MKRGSKIVALKNLAKIVSRLKKQGKKIITTNGAFDILHVGHTRALAASKELGDVLIVGISSDSSVKKYKSKNRPIISEKDRAEMVAALESTDYVTIFSETDPKKFLSIVKPDVHTKSGDYTVEQLLETPLVRKNGGTVVIIPYLKGKSTTSIIERIKGT
jgi:glycerol-3-phosphate cytidylyltransferase